MSEPKAWFAVPGMNGEFSYWLEVERAQVQLVTKTWSRVFGGSGERHVVTTAGARLVDEGFV